jgi:Flp pilus assembly protein TadB
MLEETRDPFYVPPRERELGTFAGVALVAIALVIAALMVPLDSSNAQGLLLIGAFTLLMFVLGMRQRRRRLRRLQEVEDLRASLSAREL